MDESASSPDQRAVYDAIVERATRYAFRLVPHERAREVAHDVAVELLRDTTDAPAAPVVYVAVVRRLRDASRAVRRRAARESVYLEMQGDRRPPWATPGAEIEARELGDRIEAAVATMPAGMREVFLLVREQRLSYKEVSVRLGISVGTVHTQLSRATASLRECVKQYYADSG